MKPEHQSLRRPEQIFAEANLNDHERTTITHTFPSDLDSQLAVVRHMGKLAPIDSSIYPTFPGNVTAEEAISAIQAVERKKKKLNFF
ncbi:MAG: hypothetical protein COV60_00335 [Candidatus Magasanikbacteria bacterium CG11_big_fil_rev_8_21_14_0_20_43_7]|uniref:Uncharacterized protein n=1 Tax=Candidatus Magasanikbacteria bacterium CG11_big_fil_rev_8_21_14_0_20_43_7 TaxID=1974654 RepID=A0A2H0N3G6_9BACT|nr:MAG: hypothetical protein COV60_00335 [Candidatus Magasanikbacteria bacterium CG11_big_fil_rev_8_21_14_0_20_43_7]